MGFMLGVLITTALLSPMNPPIWLRYIAYLVNGIIGFCIFKSAKSMLIRVTTAIIGSFMFFYGLNMVISKHGSENLAMQRGFYMEPKFWGYLSGIIILTLIGTFIQYKFMPEPDLGKDSEDGS